MNGRYGWMGNELYYTRKWFCKSFILSYIIPANGFVKIGGVENRYTSRGRGRLVDPLEFPDLAIGGVAHP